MSKVVKILSFLVKLVKILVFFYVEILFFGFSGQQFSVFRWKFVKILVLRLNLCHNFYFKFKSYDLNI